MMVWTEISNVSAIITCILFLFYIAGSVWGLFRKKKYITTSVKLDYAENPENIDVFDLVVNKMAPEVVLLTSSCNISSIRIYNCEYDPQKNRFIRKKQCIDSKKNIPANTVLRIRCVVPEGIPENQIVITREDGLKEIFEIGADNSNVGEGVSIAGYRIKATIGACLYQILK